MYQILQFCILRQFKYVIVYLQCFNLFLCSHGYLLFTKVSQVMAHLHNLT